MTLTGTVKPTIFHYEKPANCDDKVNINLTRGLAIQAMATGGENNLHAHPHGDGYWFVLKGVARFYTVDDRVIAELKENQGILIPAGYPYWFEHVEDADHIDLEIAHFSAGDLTPRDPEAVSRIDYEPIKESQVGETNDNYFATAKIAEAFDTAARSQLPGYKPQS